jgi:GT2 family glycosyltransferase
MSTPAHQISVLTVTYGNRWPYLEQMLKRLLSSANVAEVVIIDNASSYSVAEAVQQLSDPRTIVITNTQNKGSAGGYNAAINYAYKSAKADLLWLLDDDNLPATNVIDQLLQKWDTIEPQNHQKALFCLREDRATHIKIARGEDPYRYYLVPDNFLGFSLFRIMRNRLYKLNDRFGTDHPYLPQAKIPYAPYGGLMFHRDLVRNIGLPNADMFLYVDDSEYTYRITQNGGNIWLIPSCTITDLETSQGINYKKRLFHSHLIDQWNFRTYYHIRNRMYFYSRVAIKNKIAFKINKFLYLTYLQIVSLLSCRVRQYKKLLQAVNDGLSGNLGRADNDKI